MPPAAPLCPYALLVTGPLAEDARVAACSIPGVKFHRGKLIVPWHALKIVDALGLTYKAVHWAVPPQKALTWEEIEERLRAGGEVRPEVFEPGFLLDHQHNALLRGAHQTGFHIHHATGAGKTLSAYLLALLTAGTVVFVTKSSARTQMARELTRFTYVQPYVLRSTSAESPETIDARVAELRKLLRQSPDPEAFAGLEGATKADEKRLRKAEREARQTQEKLTKQLARALDRQERVHAAHENTYERYLQKREAAGERAFLIVGWDTLVSYMPLIRQIGPTVVVFDESHRGKSSKRWDRIPLGSMPDLDDQPGEYQSILEAQSAEAKARGGFVAEDDGARTMIVPKNNMSVAGGELARLSSVLRRICTTATPVKNLLQDFWSQLDFAEPNAWGNADSFEKRYCNKHRDNNGFMDSKGISNPEELVERLRFVVHRVEYAETHRTLPPKRRQSLYVAPEDQCAPTGDFVREVREAKARGSTAVIEVKLAEAASKKRKVVCSYVEDHVRSGHKVVLFTARRRDCEELGKELRRVLGKDMQIWALHGGQSESLRQQAIDDYMAHPGPCVFIGTGDAFGECVRPDELILGADTEIQKCEAGMPVFGAVGVTAARGRKSKMFVGDMIEIRGVGTLPVATTPNHLYLVAEGTRAKARGRALQLGLPLWKPAEKVRPWDPRPDQPQMACGDYLLIPRYEGRIAGVEYDLGALTKVKGREARGLPRMVQLDMDFAWVLGLFAAEGSTSETINKAGSRSLSATWSLSSAEEESLAARLISILRAKGFKPYTRLIGKRKTGLNVTVKSTPLARLLRGLCGIESHGKKMPLEVLLHRDVAVLRAFLDAYSEGDGHAGKADAPSFRQTAPVSPLLARHVQLGLARLGRLGRITVVPPGETKIEGRTYKTRQTYIVSWEWETLRHPRFVVLEEFIAVPVTSVQTVPYAGEVYDIGTEDRTFLAGNVVVHNSLNIQDTDAAFFVMLPYTPGQLRQWEGRFARHGQKRPVIIYYVIAERTIDEHIAGILIDKLPAIEKVALDAELAAAGAVLGGIEDGDAIVESIVGKLTFYEDDEE